MLKNKTTRKTLIKAVEHATSSSAKALGLMFKTNYNKALIFHFKEETKALATVHNIFVFFPIDLIYLNSNKKIIDIKRNFKPFSLYYAPKKPAKYLIETKKGKIKGIKLGDTLKW